MGRIKTGPWSAREDALLASLVARLGTGNWPAVASGLGGRRTCKSCRLRWHNQLNPEINKTPFTEWEQAVIVMAQSDPEFANRWAVIARLLQSRTDNSVKNHWNATLTRQLSRGSVENRYLQAGATLEWLLANPELRDPQEIAASSGSTMVMATGRRSGVRKPTRRQRVPKAPRQPRSEPPAPSSEANPSDGDGCDGDGCDGDGCDGDGCDGDGGGSAGSGGGVDGSGSAGSGSDDEGGTSSGSLGASAGPTAPAAAGAPGTWPAALGQAFAPPAPQLPAVDAPQAPADEATDRMPTAPHNASAQLAARSSSGSGGGSLLRFDLSDGSGTAGASAAAAAAAVAAAAATAAAATAAVAAPRAATPPAFAAPADGAGPSATARTDAAAQQTLAAFRQAAFAPQQAAAVPGPSAYDAARAEHLQRQLESVALLHQLARRRHALRLFVEEECAQQRLLELQLRGLAAPPHAQPAEAAAASAAAAAAAAAAPAAPQFHWVERRGVLPPRQAAAQLAGVQPPPHLQQQLQAQPWPSRAAGFHPAMAAAWAQQQQQQQQRAQHAPPPLYGVQTPYDAWRAAASGFGGGTAREALPGAGELSAADWEAFRALF